jgi:hypothetical protein
MPNDLSSNISQVVLEIFTEEFEKNRVATKTVTTNLLTGENKFGTAKFGDTLWTKRPHQYRTIETTDGDLTTETFNNITSGKVPFVVQNYITVPIEWTNREETLELNQLEEIIRPAAEFAVTTFETNFQTFMIENSGLSFGTVGTPLTKWGDVASFNALMMSVGVPTSGRRYCLMNPFTTRNLADTQTGLASGNNNLVDTAWENAQISGSFGGLRGLMSNSMSNFTTGAMADRVGSISATVPTQTYAAAKDTMQQTMVIDDLTDGQVIVPGDVIEIDGRYRTNIKTRQTAFDQNGNAIPWRATVVVGDTVGAGGASGAANTALITVTNAAIFETDGQYNNISTAIAENDVVTFLGDTATAYQPNLFYHENAFAVDTVKLPKLNTWDTVVTTSDGISIRVTKYSDGLTNEQFIRFDLLPAFSVLNPLFTGTGWGD